MAWAMASGALAGGLSKQSQTGYQDSTNNNAVGPAIPQRMQDFMGVGMQRLNDKIVADRQSQANRAAALARQSQANMPMGNITDAMDANRQKAMSMVSGNYGNVAGKTCSCK